MASLGFHASVFLQDKFLTTTKISQYLLGHIEKKLRARINLNSMQHTYRENTFLTKARQSALGF